MTSDPYQLHDSSIKEPPTTFWGTLKYIGPGFILSASIVGSGELIATTILGAKAGFILLWFVIFSCLIKVAIQLEFGKHAIGSGESTMAALNSIPGPRFGQANWSIWTWLALMTAKMMQVGGIVGGVVAVLLQFSGDLAQLRVLLTFLVAISVSLLVFQGYYRLIEKVSIVMIGMFTLFTLASLISLQTTEMAISSSELMTGFVPSIPPEAIVVIAIGAFGITGVGGDEIMAYNYWLMEKGYAAYTGRRNDSQDWERRAKGWIRVMYWDATFAMIAYTSMTAMFYLLGAAILHRQGIVPENENLISSLCHMYTDSLGAWAKNVFLIGAFIVLYSTLMAALAAWSRMFSDAFGRIGLYNFENKRERNRAIAIFAWVIPLIWGSLSLWFGRPGFMVIIGGIATTVILVIVLFAALFFRYRRLDKRLTPNKLYDIALWLSSVAILIVAVVGARDIGKEIKKSFGDTEQTEEEQTPKPPSPEK